MPEGVVVVPLVESGVAKLDSFVCDEKGRRLGSQIDANVGSRQLLWNS